MAKRPKLFSSFLDLASGLFPAQKLDEVLPAPTKSKARLISESERSALIENAINTKGAATPRNANFSEYIRRISRQSAQNRVENAKILQMAPEINQAMSIIWPAIMAPNDLKADKLEIISQCQKITPEQRVKIGKLLTDFFDRHLDLSTAVPEWGKDSMYKTGAKPLLVLPVKNIEKLLGDTKKLQGSLESLQPIINEQNSKSLYGINDSDKDRESRISKVVGATEGLVGAALEDTTCRVKKKSAIRSYDRQNGTETQSNEKYKSFVNSVLSLESLSIIDNPTGLAIGEAQRRAGASSRKKKTAQFYTDKPVESITINRDDTVVDHPILIELTKESVIPVFAPGNCNDHLGYFILLDEWGHPANVAEFAERGLNTRLVDNVNTNNFDQLFQAFGYENAQNAGNTTMSARDHDVMADIYRSIVEAHIQSTASKSNLGAVDIGTNETVFRYMFSQYLQKRKTKLLFVPPELLVYFCFKKDANGIGVSKLEELKHILSLRTTLMTVRLLSAVDSSINRKKLTINVPPDFEGDLVEHVYEVLNAAIRKSTFQFGYDPASISAQVADQQYTVAITGVPEFDYAISEEQVQKQRVEVDEQLFEALTKLFILGLDVPPAALNALSEDEYSRSVATMNLFFSRKIVSWQQITADAIGSLVRIFVTYSAPLRQDIEEILKVDSAGKTHSIRGSKVKPKSRKIKSNDGTITSDGPTVIDAKDIINEVIESLTIDLPAPNIAPDNAQIDSMEKILENVDRMVTLGLPDDLSGGNEDVGRALTFARASAKIGIVQSFFKQMGFHEIKIPLPDEVDINQLLSYRTGLINVAAAINQNDAVFVPAMGRDTLTGNSGDSTPDGQTQDPDETDDGSAGTGDEFLDQDGGAPEEGDQTPQEDTSEPEPQEGDTENQTDAGIGDTQQAGPNGKSLL